MGSIKKPRFERVPLSKIEKLVNGAKTLGDNVVIETPTTKQEPYKTGVQPRATKAAERIQRG